MADPDHERKRLLNSLSLRHLRLVLALDKTRSVGRTAEVLHLSPAAISKTRAEIEAILGMPVFENRNRRWQPTAIGEEMIASARRVMAELEYLTGEFVLLREGLHGSVALGYRTTSLTSFIASTTSRFKAMHPDLGVRLIDGSLPLLLEGMESGEIDLIISPIVTETSFAISSALLRHEEHVVVASRGHPLAGRRPLALADLIDQAWCMPPVGTRMRMHLEDALARAGLPPPRDLIEANSLLMTVALMQQMPLLSMMPVGMAWQLEAEIATILPVAVGDLSDALHLIWPAGLAIQPPARRLRDFILQEGAAMAPSTATIEDGRVAVRVRDGERRFRFVDGDAGRSRRRRRPG